MMGRRIVVLLLGLVLLLSGCWSRIEISELAIIVAMGFDYEEGSQPYRVTMQVARVGALVRGGAAQGQSKGPPVEVITGVGPTPHEAARNLQRGIPRRFHPQHNEVWIIGEEMAHRGIAPLMDFFERYNLARPNMLVVVAHGPARDVLQISENLERTLAETITGLMRFRTYTASTMRVTVNDVGLELARTGRQPVIPGVRIEKGTVDKGQPMVILDSLAIFRHDRMVGWLPPEANLGFLWVRNKVARGVTNVPCPGEPKGLATVEFTRGGSAQRAEFERGEPVVFINAKIEASLTAQECLGDLATPRGMEMLATATQEKVSRIIDEAVKVAQGRKSDVLAFGELFYRSAPDYWRRVQSRWDDEIFPGVAIRITTEVHMRRAGLSVKPITHDHEAEGGG